MVVRRHQYYYQLFWEFGYGSFKYITYYKDGMLDEKMMAYILIKDVWLLSEFSSNNVHHSVINIGYRTILDIENLDYFIVNQCIRIAISLSHLSTYNSAILVENSSQGTIVIGKSQWLHMWSRCMWNIGFVPRSQVIEIQNQKALFNFIMHNIHLFLDLGVLRFHK